MVPGEQTEWTDKAKTISLQLCRRRGGGGGGVKKAITQISKFSHDLYLTILYPSVNFQ